MPLTDDNLALKVKERPLADSAEESTYIHPASKARFGSQHKGQVQLDNGNVPGL